MNSQPICSGCNKPVVPNAPNELCPQCLIKAGLPSNSEGFRTENGWPKPSFAPPEPEDLAPLFPQLEIFKLVGKGGMGAVYKARQKQLDRIVALKILPPGIGQEAAFAERFAREARALAKLNHPGIVTLYEFGQVSSPLGPGPQQLYYFLMEFVDGVNLRRLLAQGRISASEALAIVPQICEALQFAHDHGVVHRDIKPENILLDRSGRVKVADFGLAKIVGTECPAEEFSGENVRATSGRITIPGKVMGTPHYMSPEQVEAPGSVDHRTDIYALGVVFYQMLTGELPGQKLEPPSKKVQIDVRLDEVVLRALEKSPDRRYQQVSIFRTELETIAGTARPTAYREPGSFARNRFGVTRSRIAWGIGLLVLAVLALVVSWSSIGGRHTVTASHVIVEGKGWQGLMLGATRDELVKAFGETDSDATERWLTWKQKQFVDCLVDARGAFELRFNPGFPGTTSAGIKIGSSLAEALAAYGQPSSQSDRGTAKRLIWSSRGILLWFNDDQVTQIVVFEKSE